MHFFANNSFFTHSSVLDTDSTSSNSIKSNCYLLQSSWRVPEVKPVQANTKQPPT